MLLCDIEFDIFGEAAEDKLRYGAEPDVVQIAHLVDCASGNLIATICECRVSALLRNHHNALSVCTTSQTSLHPPESQIPRSREIDSFFCIRWLAKSGYLGADPAKFSRSRILQSDKIGCNSMQFFSRSKSNPKRREHGVTNFSLS